MKKVRQQVRAQWEEIARTLRTQLIVISEKPKEILSRRVLLERAKLIICFRCQPEVIFLLRDVLKIRTRLAIYSHGSPAIGMTNFFPILKHLTQLDAVIFASVADREAADSFAKNLPGLVVGLGYETFYPGHAIQHLQAKQQIRNIDFVGRISLQKNLTVVLQALRLLLADGGHYKLRIFGQIDNLGIRQLGDKYEVDIQRKINDFILEYDLGKHVQFMGEMPLHKIQRIAAKNSSVLVSPSTHLHENFGFTIRERLAAGGKVVLSSWGGYRDAIDLFPELCFPVPVFKNRDHLPAVRPQALAEAVKNAFNTIQHLPDVEIQKRISESNSEARRTLLKFIKNTKSGRTPSPKALPILHRIIGEFKPVFPKHEAIIFSSARHPGFQKLISAYGCDSARSMTRGTIPSMKGTSKTLR